MLLLSLHRTTAFGNLVVRGDGWWLSQDLELADHDVERLRRDEVHLWLYGYIAYRDYLDRHWRKGFIGLLDARTTRWHPVADAGDAGGVFEQPPPEAGVQAYTYTRPDAAVEEREAER
jgi:hypothetical protein